MTPLSHVYQGWDGYQTSLLHALEPLTSRQLAWRPAQGRRSLGETFRHISLGRVEWFARVGAPGIDGVTRQIPEWRTDSDGVRYVVEPAVASDDPADQQRWLQLSWEPIRRVLEEWTVADLDVTYPHRWQGRSYANSRQWTIWRIMAHDIHHGGQIAMMLGMLDIEAFELRALGGHIVMPGLADSEG
jgi:uncharacterized damage-inducible protein DinB